jgi:hypothetical protein
MDFQFFDSLIKSKRLFLRESFVSKLDVGRASPIRSLVLPTIYIDKLAGSLKSARGFDSHRGNSAHYCQPSKRLLGDILSSSRGFGNENGNSGYDDVGSFDGFGSGHGESEAGKEESRRSQHGEPRRQERKCALEIAENSAS